MSDGQTSVAVGDEAGRVVLRFPEPVSWIAMDPENARLIAEAVAKAAFKCRYGVSPISNKSMISEEIRKRLVTRVALVMKSCAESGKSNGYIARQVIDVIMREVA